MSNELNLLKPLRIRSSISKVKKTFDVYNACETLAFGNYINLMV